MSPFIFIILIKYQNKKLFANIEKWYIILLLKGR